MSSRLSKVQYWQNMQKPVNWRLLANLCLRWAYITSEQLSQVKLGDEVTVYADYGNSEQKAYPGVVTWISDRSEFTPKTILTKNERANLVYAVKIAVKNDGALKIGMYGGVTLKN